MTLATCPVRYAGAFNAAVAAVPYVAWPIIHTDYSMGGRPFMQWRQWGQEASRPGSATIFQCPQARLLTSLNLQFLIFKLRRLDKELHPVPFQNPRCIYVALSPQRCAFYIT